MWLDFDNIEFRTDLESRKGTTYSGHVVTGTKRGFDGADDEPFSKVYFDNHVVDVVQGADTIKMDLVEFFQLCEAGDLLITKSEKAGTEVWNWKVARIENRTRKVIDAASMKVEACADHSSDLLYASAVTSALFASGKFVDEIKDADMSTSIKLVRSTMEAVLEDIADTSGLTGD